MASRAKRVALAATLVPGTRVRLRYCFRGHAQDYEVDAGALDNEHICAYKRQVRRKPGQLVPLEVAICLSAARLLGREIKEFYGYEIAKQLADEKDRPVLTAYGTLYRALGRLEEMGLLESRWEESEIAARESRPGRRLYTLTGAGEAAVEDTRIASTTAAPKRARRRLAPA